MTHRQPEGGRSFGAHADVAFLMCREQRRVSYLLQQSSGLPLLADGSAWEPPDPQGVGGDEDIAAGLHLGGWGEADETDSDEDDEEEDAAAPSAVDGAVASSDGLPGPSRRQPRVLLDDAQRRKWHRFMRRLRHVWIDEVRIHMTGGSGIRECSGG